MEGSRPSGVAGGLTRGQRPCFYGPMYTSQCGIPFCPHPPVGYSRRMRICGHEEKPVILFCEDHAKYANSNAENKSACRTCRVESKIRIGPLRPLSEVKIVRRNGA